MNYSFWADEAYIAGIASQLATGKYSILQAFNALSYQKLYILVLSVFFKLFGISEMTARLPSMIAFFIGSFLISSLCFSQMDGLSSWIPRRMEWTTGRSCAGLL